MLGLGNSLMVIDSFERFLLTDISDLSLWYRNGYGITLDSGGAGGASQWDDSSGNANHATQATVGDQAVPAEGGLDFELGDGDHYDIGTEITISAQQGFTTFLVAKMETTGVNATILSKANTQHFFEFMSGADNIRLRLGSTNTVVTPDSSNLWIAGTKFLITVVRESGITGNIIIYKDGVLVSQATAGQASNTGDGEYSIVGARNSAGSEDRFFDGIIHELAFYEKQLSTNELADVHSYLLDKHGL
tara:strand:+ start:548 stop:1288 length:741 start_codon:yes stop_codon:yes gene_type:complete